jgi:hypothetical protein
MTSDPDPLLTSATTNEANTTTTAKSPKKSLSETNSKKSANMKSNSKKAAAGGGAKRKKAVDLEDEDRQSGDEVVDLYKEFGVAKSATQDQLKKAYYKVCYSTLGYFRWMHRGILVSVLIRLLHPTAHIQ